MDKVIIIGVSAAIAVGTLLYYLLTEKEKPQRMRRSNRSSSPPRRHRSPPASLDDVRTEEAERERKETERRRKETERKRKETERKRKETERKRRETEAQVSSEPCEKFEKETETPVSSFEDSNLVPNELVGKSETHVSSDPDPTIPSKIPNDSHSWLESNKSKPDSEPGEDLREKTEGQVSSEPCEQFKKETETCVSSDPDPADPSKILNDSQSSHEISNDIFPFSTPSLAMCHVCDEPANAILYPCKHHNLCSEHAQYYFDLAKNLNQVARCPAPDCRTKLEYFIV